jgi:hypothetical protein
MSSNRFSVARNAPRPGVLVTRADDPRTGHEQLSDQRCAMKASSLVTYYDLFADRLGYEQLTPVRNPSIHAKWVVLSYRLALDLLILVTIGGASCPHRSCAGGCRGI